MRKINLENGAIINNIIYKAATALAKRFEVIDLINKKYLEGHLRAFEVPAAYHK